MVVRIAHETAVANTANHFKENTVRNLYCIIDTLANDIVGQILVARNDTVAVRTFSDICTAKEPNIINQHIADFDLVKLGEIDEDEPTQLTPRYAIIITGKQWLAAQQRDNSQMELVS